MKFWNKLGKMLKPHPDLYRTAVDLIDRFEPADEKALADSGEAMLSFLREHCIRGNARQFQIVLDGREAARLRLDAQCSLTCEPGFHKLYVKLDTLKSPILNLKAEAGRRYFFDIACTMEDGMILQHVEDTRERKEE